MELRKGVHFVVWYGISFLPLFWTTFLWGMAHAQLLTLLNASLVPSAHRAIGKNVEIFILSRSKTSERGKTA